MTQPPDNILSEWALWGLTQPPKAIEAVHGGLTNANFLIECDSGQLLLRLNNNGQSQRSVSCVVLIVSGGVM